jgi:hypothetical protein
VPREQLQDRRLSTTRDAIVAGATLKGTAPSLDPRTRKVFQGAVSCTDPDLSPIDWSMSLPVGILQSTVFGGKAGDLKGPRNDAPAYAPPTTASTM